MGLGRFGISPLLHRGIEAVRCCLCPLTYVSVVQWLTHGLAKAEMTVQFRSGALTSRVIEQVY